MMKRQEGGATDVEKKEQARTISALGRIGQRRPAMLVRRYEHHGHRVPASAALARQRARRVLSSARARCR